MDLSGVELESAQKLKKKSNDEDEDYDDKLEEKTEKAQNSNY